MAEAQKKQSSPLIRGGVVALLVVLAGVALKMYQESQQIDEEAERAEIDARLEALHDGLVERLKQESDADAALEALPTHVEWLPAEMPCGGGFTAIEEPRGPWVKLWTPRGEGEEALRVRYQFGLRRHGAKVTWMARRDRDCDGLYEVHTLRASLDWSGALQQTHVEVQNLNE